MVTLTLGKKWQAQVEEIANLKVEKAELEEDHKALAQKFTQLSGELARSQFKHQALLKEFEDAVPDTLMDLNSSALKCQFFKKCLGKSTRDCQILAALKVRDGEQLANVQDRRSRGVAKRSEKWNCRAFSSIYHETFKYTPPRFMRDCFHVL